MKRLNWLLTLSTVTILLVIIERLSFTTKIILQPYYFLRLHEAVQMVFIILATVIIPFFILKEVTNNFEKLKTTKGLIFAVTFITGIYFYSTGNGLHEVASYLFNTFCDTDHFTSRACGSMFFNDYYFGNILYFIGAYLMNIPLILYELSKPFVEFDRKNLIILTINAVLYSVAIIAYAALDRVIVGLVFSVIFMLSVIFLMLTAKQPFRQIPFTLYCVISYTLGTIISFVIRFH